MQGRLSSDDLLPDRHRARCRAAAIVCRRVVRRDGRKMKLYHPSVTVVVSTNPIDAYTVLPIGP